MPLSSGLDYDGGYDCDGNDGYDGYDVDGEFDRRRISLRGHGLGFDSRYLYDSWNLHGSYGFGDSHPNLHDSYSGRTTLLQ
jgi:hypothetical protein